MEAETLDTWLVPCSSLLDSLLSHPLLEPPYGYAIGIGVWPAYLALWYATVFTAELLGAVPFSLSVVVGAGGLLVTSVGSVLAMCITAWRTPYARLRRQSPGIFVTFLFGLLTASVYFGSPPLLPSPYSVIAPLGLDAFGEHALVTTGLLGPAIGLAFLAFALFVLAVRYRLQEAT